VPRLSIYGAIPPYNFMVWCLIKHKERFTFFTLIDGGNEDGAFLVRESNTAVGDYVLSVLHEGEVVHYQIRRHGEDAFFSIGKYNFVKLYMWGIILK
jgi:hypothetical protein